MKLIIDTTNPDQVTLTLSGDKLAAHQFQTNRNLSEILIPQIQKFLSKQKVKLADLTSVQAKTGEGHFSRIRTGVATANAIAYALGLKQAVIQPIYDKEPNITLKK